MTAELHPAVELAVMVEQNPPRGRVHDQRRAGDVADLAQRTEDVRVLAGEFYDAAHVFAFFVISARMRFEHFNHALDVRRELVAIQVLDHQPQLVETLVVAGILPIGEGRVRQLHRRQRFTTIQPS